MTAPRLAALAAALLAAPAQGQEPVTPTPVLTLGSPCAARVTLSWDVSSIPNTTRVLWELDSDPGFSNPTGGEPGRLDRGTESGPVGSVTLDLREYGRVLDGTRYHMRVVAKEGSADLARRSDGVVFDVDRTPEGTYGAVASPGQNAIGLLWGSLDPGIRGCSDRVFWEVKTDTPFTAAGADPTRFDAGDAAVSANQALIDLGSRPPGTYYVRLVGKHGGLDPGSDVGRRGAGVAVTVAPPMAATPPPPRPTSPRPTSPPTATPTAYRITRFTLGETGPAVEGPVVFRFEYDGPDPTRYRVGDCRNFERSAAWRPYAPTARTAVELTPGPRSVCLQISAPGPKGERLSEIARRSVDVLRENTEPLQLVRLMLWTEDDRGSAEYAFTSQEVFGRAIVRGSATHLRYAECDGFEEWPWRPWDGTSSPSTRFGSTGPRELCLQVKSEPPGTAPRVSAIERARIEIVGPLVRRVVTDEVSNGYLQSYARQNGFSMSHNLFGGTKGSDCDIVYAVPASALSTSGLVLYGPGSTKTMCKFAIFAGRALNAPWTVESVSVPPSTCVAARLVRTPRRGTRSLSTTIEARPRTARCAAQKSLGFKISITLSGPAGADWRDAFRK